MRAQFLGLLLVVGCRGVFGWSVYSNVTDGDVGADSVGDAIDIGDSVATDTGSSDAATRDLGVDAVSDSAETAVTKCKSVTFANAVTYATGSSPYAIAVGDFNGDGKSDLAIANYADNTVTVLINNDNGTFTAQSPHAVGAGPCAIAAGDFNGDGKSDLAVANCGTGAGTVSVLISEGTTFGSQTVLATGGQPVSVAVADFSKDGKPDIAVANNVSNNVGVLINAGNGSFNGQQTYAAAPSSGTTPNSVVAGDFNGDGIADLAVANFGEDASGIDTSSVDVLINSNGGTTGIFGLPLNYLSDDEPQSLVVGDFNNDTKPDLALVCYGSDEVGLFENLGAGEMSDYYAFWSSYDYPSSLAVGDINGDDVPDLAVANSDGSVDILINNGGNTFTDNPVVAPTIADTSVPPATFIAVGDFNGDGRPDLAFGNSSVNGVTVMLNTCK